MGVRKFADVGSFLPIHFKGNPDTWIRDMGGDPLHWEGPGGGSTTGRHNEYQGINHIDDRMRAGIYPYGGLHEGVRPGGDGDLYLQAS